MTVLALHKDLTDEDMFVPEKEQEVRQLLAEQGHVHLSQHPEYKLLEEKVVDMNVTVHSETGDRVVQRFEWQARVEETA